MTESAQTVRVDLGNRSYDICLGENLLPRSNTFLSNWLRSIPNERLKYLIVTDSNVLHPHANTVKSALQAADDEFRVVCVKAGESSKCLAECSELYDQLIDFKADRKTVVVAVGGGVVGDLAGFVAATYARGLRFVQIPTTLLAMVDSSVGGKTGINHPKGKNLIGAFHQPSGVLIDTQTLATLPDREFTAGLAEVVKYGVILDKEFFEYLEQNVSGLLNRDAEVLQHVIARSCQLKADVVREDEFETTGLRAILNYGHTYAHAFEALSGYGQLLHGEAVSIGMMCGIRLAHRLGRIEPADVVRQRNLLSAVGLPVDVPPGLQAQADDIIQCMLLDKKTVSGDLKFVLPDKIGHVETVGGIDRESVIACLSGD